MSTGHRLYIAILSAIVLIAAGLLVFSGFPYYRLPLEERFFHAAHEILKPAGPWGHGLGIAGTLSMISGILLYMARKRMRWLSRFGLLKHWLEFHIFLCTLGPLLILFHTAFKFGGIVAVSFWSMVAVFLSGIVGRFIYIQIPRSIEGRELTLSEVQDLKTNIGSMLTSSYGLDEESIQVILDSARKRVDLYHSTWLAGYLARIRNDRRALRSVKNVVRKSGLSNKEQGKVVVLVKQEISLNRRIGRLLTMQKLFRYWHVAHLPFALVMLIIMVVHVIVTIVFGYRWIF
jgi:hypothetical protein